MQMPVEKILEDVLKLMDSFKYTENEDRPSNSFFEAELNEDGFFILRHEIESFIKGAKNTEVDDESKAIEKMKELAEGRKEKEELRYKLNDRWLFYYQCKTVWKS